MRFDTVETQRSLLVQPQYARLAEAQTIESLYLVSYQAQQSNAPIIQTPPSAPGTYVATDGTKYFVPLVRIAFRSNMPLTRDIAFKRDANGWNIVMLLELVRPPGTDPTATLFLPESFVVAIQPGDGTAAFTFATVSPMQLTGRGADVVGVLQARGPVDETAGVAMLRDKPKSALSVTGHIQYRHVIRVPVNPGDPGNPGGPHPWMHDHLQIPEMEIPVSAAQGISETKFDIARLPIDQKYFEYGSTTRTVDGTVDAELGQNEPTCFPSDFRDNQPIYANVLGGTGDVALWSQQNGLGYTHPSVNSDEYYTLPHSFRLAIDSGSSLPSMQVILITTPPATHGGSATYTVRVKFQIAPLLDGAKLEILRASLRFANDLPYPKFSIGGYSSATFIPSGLFSNLPESGDTPTATPPPRPVDAANGFELIMDCTLELYTLLTKLLVTSDGIEGSVQFALVTARDGSSPPVETQTLVSVPVKLSLVGPFPVSPATTLQTSSPPDPKPVSVSLAIANPLSVPLQIDGIFPTLLDGNATMDLTASATRVTPTMTSISIAPNATMTVVARQNDGSPLPDFSVLATTYGTTTPTYDPQAVLAHYHELASSTGIAATAHFSCYLLKHPDKIPATLAGLIGMQIEVQRGAGPVVAIPLTLDTPESDVEIPYSFGDLLAGLSLNEPSFRYRAKSLFPDHSGDFSAWIDNTGHDVVVTPV